MNIAYPSCEVPLPDPESLGWDPLNAFTGVMWSSLAGGAFWLTVLALVLSG